MIRAWEGKGIYIYIYVYITTRQRTQHVRQNKKAYRVNLYIETVKYHIYIWYFTVLQYLTPFDHISLYFLIFCQSQAVAMIFTILLVVI